MNLLIVLDRPIAFQRHFVTITGSINAALMLSQAVYWSGRSSLSDDWFYKTQEEWQEETGMTRRELDGARKILGEKGLMLEARRGVPGKLHFKVQASNLEKLCTETPSAQRTKPPKSMHQNANVNAPKRQCNTETTTETTQKTALRLPRKAVAVATTILPAWLDAETWAEFRSMRKSIRASMTPHAEKLLLDKLERYRTQGHDPKMMLERAIVNCWKDVYPDLSPQRSSPASVKLIETEFKL